MTRMRKLWVPLLVGLLVAGLLGVGGGAVAVEPRLTTANIMIPAAAFIPTTNTWDYDNNGVYLGMSSGSGNFAVPLSFPVPVVSIKKITLYVLDNDAADICATLYRPSPATGSEISTGTVCSSGTSTTDPQVLITTAISPRGVNTASQGPYLWVNIGGGSTASLKLYGVKVTYTYDTGA